MAPSNKGIHNEGHHIYQGGSYVPAEYEHQEYPKFVKDAEGGDVIVHSADEESALASKQEETEPTE
jgi:hypothetical protein